MPKLKRKTQKIFGGSILEGSQPAPNGVIAKFGSLKAGKSEYAHDPDEIQALPAYGGGWADAIMRNNIPPLQDMNALQYLFSRQLAYLMQSGIPEWHKNQEYHNGSFCRSAGALYVSTCDNNIGNKVGDSDSWRLYAPRDIGPTEDRPGPTESNPTAPAPPLGFIYMDTEIGVELRWTEEGWTTNAGSPGDLKVVAYPDFKTVMEKNPGWALHEESARHAIFGAESGVKEPYPGTKKSGGETVALTVSHIPKHKHDFKFCRDHGNTGGKDSGICSYKNLSGDYVLGSSVSQVVSNNALVQEEGGGVAHDNMPPAIYLWRLVKKY